MLLGQISRVTVPVVFGKIVRHSHGRDLWDGPVVIMLSKINITLSISISVPLNHAVTFSSKREWQGRLQLAGGVVLHQEGQRGGYGDWAWFDKETTPKEPITII